MARSPFLFRLQAVAFALVQASVDDSPRGIEVGDADNATVGAATLAWALSCAPTCPEISSEKASKPSLIVVNTVRRNMRRYS